MLHPPGSKQYRLATLDRLLGLITLFFMLALLVWALTDIGKMLSQVQKLEAVFRSRPVIMSIFTICVAAALGVPLIYVWGFLKQLIFRETVIGDLEHVEKIERRNGKRSLVLTISGKKYEIACDQLLDDFIVNNALEGRRVRMELRGAHRVFSLCDHPN